MNLCWAALVDYQRLWLVLVTVGAKIQVFNEGLVGYGSHVRFPCSPVAATKDATPPNTQPIPAAQGAPPSAGLPVSGLRVALGATMSIAPQFGKEKGTASSRPFLRPTSLRTRIYFTATGCKGLSGPKAFRDDPLARVYRSLGAGCSGR